MTAIFLIIAICFVTSVFLIMLYDVFCMFLPAILDFLCSVDIKTLIMSVLLTPIVIIILSLPFMIAFIRAWEKREKYLESLEQNEIKKEMGDSYNNE